MTDYAALTAGGIRFASGVSFLISPEKANKFWGDPEPVAKPTAYLLLHSMGYRDALIGGLLIYSGLTGRDTAALVPRLGRCRCGRPARRNPGARRDVDLREARRPRRCRRRHRGRAVGRSAPPPLTYSSSANSARTFAVARCSDQNDRIGMVPQISVTRVKPISHFARRDRMNAVKTKIM